MAKPKSDDDLTITCPHCLKIQKPHPWVFAHWDQSLTATCEHCDKQFGFRSGKTWKV